MRVCSPALSFPGRGVHLQSFDVSLPSLFFTLNRINVRHFYPRFSADLASSVLAHQTQAIVKCIIAHQHTTRTLLSRRDRKTTCSHNNLTGYALCSYNQLHFSNPNPTQLPFLLHDSGTSTPAYITSTVLEKDTRLVSQHPININF